MPELDADKIRVGSLTVKVVPDLSGIEPAVRAEFDRIGAAIRIGEAAVDEVHAALCDAAPWVPMPEEVAAKLLQQFVIVKRKDASES